MHPATVVAIVADPARAARCGRPSTPAGSWRSRRSASPRSRWPGGGARPSTRPTFRRSTGSATASTCAPRPGSSSPPEFLTAARALRGSARRHHPKTSPGARPNRRAPRVRSKGSFVIDSIASIAGIVGRVRRARRRPRRHLRVLRGAPRHPHRHDRRHRHPRDTRTRTAPRRDRLRGVGRTRVDGARRGGRRPQPMNGQRSDRVRARGATSPATRRAGCQRPARRRRRRTVNGG